MLNTGMNISQEQLSAEANNVTILWDYRTQADRKIEANKPDITVKDKREKKLKN